MIQKFSDIEAQKHPFGFFREYFSSEDLDFGFASFSIEDDILHYHKKTTELYVSYAGKGKIILDDETHNFIPGDAVLIKPFTKHKAYSESDTPITFYVFSIPAFDPDDVFEVQDK